MGHFFGKRAEALTATVLIVLIVAVFLGWFINFNSKECRSDSQCQYGYYCGSDFSCHEMPVIERTLTENSLLAPSLILGIAIVAAAFIMKSKNGSRNRNHGHDEHAKPEHQQRLKTP